MTETEDMEITEQEAIALRWCAQELLELARKLGREAKRNHIVQTVINEACALDRRFQQEWSYLVDLKGKSKTGASELDGQRELNL